MLLVSTILLHPLHPLHPLHHPHLLHARPLHPHPPLHCVNQGKESLRPRGGRVQSQNGFALLDLAIGVGDDDNRAFSLSLVSTYLSLTYTQGYMQRGRILQHDNIPRRRRNEPI